jgi:hypothetical protein
MEKHSIRDLVAALRSQYGKVRALAAFADLKQSECRHGNSLDMWAYLQAQDEYAVEAAILLGHADMLQASAADQHHPLAPETIKLLANIRQLAQRPAPSQHDNVK